MLPPEELPSLLDGVLTTLHLLFNEGYKASSGERLIREELCHEALRLCTQLAAHPSTKLPRTHALLALMYLTAARFPARTDEAGMLLRLHEQDRSKWDKTMMARGVGYLAESSKGESLSEYHFLAGIAACHGLAESPEATDWPRILKLYDGLIRLKDSPLIRLSRVVAVERVEGSAAALESLDRLNTRSALSRYYLFYAVRGSLPISGRARLPGNRESVPPRLVEESERASERRGRSGLACEETARENRDSLVGDDTSPARLDLRTMLFGPHHPELLTTAFLPRAAPFLLRGGL